ncbi:hypothetical protein BVRB_5g101890 [Beta vulgaris subsp. vulgaris]|uniref:PWWP domain-containing protein 5 n=1 Tax=Beta vulgaris subsp. vulgaris TaxID=3555 RepID=UPI00053FA32E|nr:PWWP domain-containing protein 5 [Beta vulgaris subsp. vulgaris]XP_048501047.1 PWWP domain-containing protein 5 [Beta vulgaris subsp. vulgaris]KMT12244.1 hypothetical protein BVRB_5g101890 [Beta vulgaris subsp. vulgaris]
MDVKIDPTLETNVHDGGSLETDLGSATRKDGDRAYRDHAAYDKSPLPHNLFVKAVDQGSKHESSVPDNLEYRTTNDLTDVDTNMEEVQEVQEQAVNTEVVESLEEQDVDQELISDSVNPRNKEEVKALEPESLMEDHRVRYQLPPENEVKFAVFDLVWGKVKSHPWWPGQIFHPSDSSEKAMKYYKKDCYLVAYFGDRTFAWNEASVLKPFRNHFPQAERLNKSEAFRNAVSCALEELARRVELGLACSCMSEEAYGKIKYQIVENSGIREESSKREGVDRSTVLDYFQPDKLSEYVRALAFFPTSGADRLELEIAKAQLLAFSQLRGYDALPDFEYYEGLVEYDAHALPGYQRMSGEFEHADSVAKVNAKKGPRKRKHNLKDIVCPRRKQKNMTESTNEAMYYPDGEFDSHEEDDITLTSPIVSAKRKASEFLSDDFTAPRSTKNISVAKFSHTATPNPQQSFKVGDCIRRVASQLTRSSIDVKGGSVKSNKQLRDGADEMLEPPNDCLTDSASISLKQSSLNEMLSQLHLSGRDPMKGYSFLGDIISFFSEYRNLAVTTQLQRLRKAPGRKIKSSVPVVGSPETFEFDDRNDSYWTDMVVQDNAVVKQARPGRKKKDEHVVSGDHEELLTRNPRKYSKKQNSHGIHVAVPEMPNEVEKKLDLPTELMLKFGEVGSVPSEMNLNKIFRRFGPLKESETEVDVHSSRARVVFKKRSDAEVAYSSAAMFNIFGSTAVNYQLKHTPLVPFRSLLAITNGKEETT